MKTLVREGRRGREVRQIAARSCWSRPDYREKQHAARQKFEDKRTAHSIEVSQLKARIAFLEQEVARLQGDPG